MKAFIVFLAVLLTVFLGLVFLSSDLWADPRVRRVQVQGDQIVTVRTSIGIATIIQVPDSPNSVVVGDQAAFKVEYLDRAITIKPLSFGAKSNLYVYTDWKRYNVQLIAGQEAAADYVVYLENPKRPEQSGSAGIVWTKYRNNLKNDDLTLEVNRLGRAKDGVLLIEFTVKGKKRESLRPDWLWLTQEGQTRPIHNLFLSSLELRPGGSAQGVLQLLRSDVSAEFPLRIELRRQKLSYLTVQKVALWK